MKSTIIIILYYDHEYFTTIKMLFLHTLQLQHNAVTNTTHILPHPYQCYCRIEYWHRLYRMLCFIIFTYFPFAGCLIFIMRCYHSAVVGCLLAICGIVLGSFCGMLRNPGAGCGMQL